MKQEKNRVRKKGERAGAQQGRSDERFMARALVLAGRGLGRTHPNPAVGAVLVKGSRVIGEGYHRRAGGPHAEVAALRNASGSTAGATLYVTLEPCPHFGRTPPCVDAILEARIARVVVGTRDPNPKVRGRGLRRLRDAGVRVATGVLESECRRLLSGYRTWVRQRRPMVVLKLAASLDGRIATLTGASRWITGRQARRRSHEMRNRLDAVMVGAGTVRADDPRLTCRIPGGRDPIRVVVDGRLSVSPRCRMLRTTSRAPTWITTSQSAPQRRAALLERAGAEVIRLRGGTTLHLKEVLRELGRRGVTSVLIEGGATLAAAALREKVVDRLVLFLAPIMIGGDGVPAVAALGTRSVARAIHLRNLRLDREGDDVVIEASLPLKPVAL